MWVFCVSCSNISVYNICVYYSIHYTSCFCISACIICSLKLYVYIFICISHFSPISITIVECTYLIAMTLEPIGLIFAWFPQYWATLPSHAYDKTRLNGSALLPWWCFLENHCCLSNDDNWKTDRARVYFVTHTHWDDAHGTHALIWKETTTSRKMCVDLWSCRKYMVWKSVYGCHFAAISVCDGWRVVQIVIASNSRWMIYFFSFCCCLDTRQNTLGNSWFFDYYCVQICVMYILNTYTCVCVCVICVNYIFLEWSLFEKVFICVMYINAHT